MSEYLIQDFTLIEIADAIRDKTGITESIPVSNMASEIANIKVGDEYKLPILNGNYPEDITSEIGSSVTAKVVIDEDGNPASYSFQWYKDNVAIEGATSPTYTFTLSSIGTSTLYCNITNNAGTVTSRYATITATAYYIMKDGAIRSDVAFTRQLRTSSTATLTTYSGYSKLSASTNYTCGLATTNKIDFTNYSTLTMDYTGAAAYFSPGITIGLLSEPGATSSESTLLAKFQYKAQSASSGRQTLKVNIASVNSSYYLGIALTPENH